MADDFAYVVHAHWRGLVRTAVFLGCSLPDAEDAAEATLRKAHRSWSRVTGAADPTAYIYRILVGTLADRPEHGGLEHGGLEDPATQPSPGLVAADPFGAETDLRDELLRLLVQLPTEQREVLVLRYVAELSEAQTATALGVRDEVVASRAALGLDACERLHEEAT